MGATRIGETVIYNDDCLKIMDSLIMLGTQVESVVTDPPYHLSTVKRFAKSTPAKFGTDGLYQRQSRGFMNKKWDGGDVAFRVETWSHCYDIIKPGGYLLAFSSSRTYHRMACAIEDAGFEIRDQIMWLYGSGFPKSFDPGRKDKQWDGWGTALKPAHEPIVMARKPMIGSTNDNLVKHGVGAINIDASRIGYRFPANVIHDGSDDVLDEFAKCGTRSNAGWPKPGGTKPNNTYGAPSIRPTVPSCYKPDSGTAARFFYSAKANKKDRAGSSHPTIKPVDLIRYLATMVTPPGGTILDPFAGSGTLGTAWPRCILIEQEVEYYFDIIGRLVSE